MKNHRIISYSCAAAATMLFAFPVAAQAGSSTLSGYGGPGEGNQAVLGSALVGAHGGGGSSGGSRASGAGSGGQGSAGAEGSATGAPAVESGASRGQGAQGAVEPRSSFEASGAGGANAKSQARSKTYPGTRGSSQVRPTAEPRSYYPAAERVPSGGQGTVLGLTADDLLYVILALVILVLVGLFTRRLDDPASSARTRG